MERKNGTKQLEQIYPGVWRLRLDEPEEFTPVTLFGHQPAVDALADLSQTSDCPIPADYITGEATPRGYLLTLPLADDEQVYGLGLQLLSVNQRGKKKTLRVNSDPVADTGDSHAPVPFYVTSHGYGVLIDSLRYITMYCGSTAKKVDTQGVQQCDGEAAPNVDGAEALYSSKAAGGSTVTVEIPVARGVDVYLFAGPDMAQAVQRFNLYAGGGCVPPLWGLGVWYRCKGDFDSDNVLAMADRFRKDQIPCDVLGLEPGWQTQAYSCSYLWSKRFPQPQEMLDKLAEKDFHVNLWTHAFTHPSSPLYEPLESRSGDYLVWNGLVPDFTNPETRRIYSEFYESEHVAKGVSGYKLDECDNSDYISSQWSFPEISKFPSGLDGEQMHSAFGHLYQKTIQSIFDRRGQRTYCEVRSSQALAAPLPYVLYSDLYDHQSFIRGVVTSGFSGLLWCPEVRHAESAEDLIRRIQSVVFSPQALVNSWYIKNPPWLQWNTEANNADQLHEDAEWVTDLCRRMFELRMQFIPYLYAAFMKYHLTGMPPFRALVMEDPSDPNLWNIDSAYMVGDRVLVAPVVAGVNERDIYLPRGKWCDFWTGVRYEGGQSYHLPVPIDRVLLFVKDNSLLPLAHPAQHAADPALRQLTVSVYGTGEQGITLYEDDGVSNAYKDGQVNVVDLMWDAEAQSVQLSRSGDAKVPGYVINGFASRP